MKVMMKRYTVIASGLLAFTFSRSAPADPPNLETQLRQLAQVAIDCLPPHPEMKQYNIDCRFQVKEYRFNENYNEENMPSFYFYDGTCGRKPNGKVDDDEAIFLGFEYAGLSCARIGECVKYMDAETVKHAQDAVTILIDMITFRCLQS